MRWLSLVSFGAMLVAYAACASFEGRAEPPTAATEAGTSDAAAIGGGSFRVILSDDFERDDVPGGRWAVSVADPVQLTLSTNFARSSTRSLRVESGTSPTVGQGTLRASLGGRHRGIRCSAHVYPVTLADTALSSLFRIRAQTNAASELVDWDMSVLMDRRSTQLLIAEFETAADPKRQELAAPGLPVNAWSEVTVDVALDDKLVTLKADGKQLLSLSLTSTLLETTDFDFWVGVSAQNVPLEYYVDDLRCFVR